MQIGRDNIRFENSQDQMKGSVDKESAHTYKKKKKREFVSFWMGAV